jgi:hypothetical protein
MIRHAAPAVFGAQWNVFGLIIYVLGSHGPVLALIFVQEFGWRHRLPSYEGAWRQLGRDAFGHVINMLQLMSHSLEVNSFCELNSKKPPSLRR